MRTIFLVLLLLAALTAPGPAARAAGGSRQEPTPRPPIPEPDVVKTPEQQAIEHYNWGIEARDRAWKAEERLAAATSADERKKLEKKIEKAYRQARGEFEQAVAQNPRMFQALSDLGYSRRKLGDYTAALEAYDRALALEPGYPEAVEYRAEAYLGLGRLDEAKEAYITLFGSRREYADKLLAAMGKWVEHQRAQGGQGADVEAFAGWVSERQEIAGQTKPVSQLLHHDW